MPRKRAEERARPRAQQRAPGWWLENRSAALHSSSVAPEDERNPAAEAKGLLHPQTIIAAHEVRRIGVVERNWIDSSNIGLNRAPVRTAGEFASFDNHGCAWNSRYLEPESV